MPKTKDINNLTLSSSITDIKGFGNIKAKSFSKLGIFSLKDALYHYPRSYEDLRNMAHSCDLGDGQQALLKGKVILVNRGKGYGKKRTLHVLAEDDTGRFEVLFFMAGYMANAFRVGDEYTFFGKVKVQNGRVTMFHPDFSLYDGENKGILPVYPLAKGLSQKDMRKVSSIAIDHIDELEETLPFSTVQHMNLCSNKDALKNIHYPKDENGYKESRYRLVFEELFGLKTALALSSKNHEKKGVYIYSGKAETFVRSLPYELTGAQKRVLNEILCDMRSDRSMNRLVQGDVGSGKTAVAMAALAEAVYAGFQGLFMAPTDILARQHFETLSKAFEPFGIKTVLLTSTMPSKDKKQVLESLKTGDASIAVGTHALISEGVEYNNVGLVITDEQHRFGVSQRMKLSAKGQDPDVLVMTATPIPRTLAVVLYADLDISIIDELPPGRQPIKTLSFKEHERRDAYKLLFEEIGKGRQGYIVAPFIEDSETVNGRSAEALYDAFVKKHPEVSCGLLHGELSQAEKDDVMESFYKGEISVLICTVVIEVGIDVPNATVMLIENAERFGLAQMHQLRGRVGRGTELSYCLICSGEESEVSKERIKTLCETSDGFVIAEKDLEIRGPGEFFGYRQHGLPQLTLADPIKHAKIAEDAGKEAKQLLEKDPDLSMPENIKFGEMIKNKYMQLDNLTI